MKLSHVLVLAAIGLTAPVTAYSQMAGSTVLAVSVAELRDVTMGWSATRQILGQPVYNDKDEKIGSIDDIIVTSGKAVSYAVVNAGGFLSVTKHNVVVPVSQFKLVDNKLVLAGATKEALKAAPAFEYAKQP